MGRQINFFISETLQDEFIDFLKENNYIFINSKTNHIYDLKSQDIRLTYLYKPDYGDIITYEDCPTRIDITKSPVIEFSKCFIKPNSNIVIRGRLWISHNYYDKNNNLVEKSPTFTKDYNQLVRWIKKHVPYQPYTPTGKIKEYVSDEMLELQKQGYILKG